MITYQLTDLDGDLVLDMHDGMTGGKLYTTSLDPGFPDVRAVMEDRAGADGQIDTTKYLGSRLITWEFADTSDIDGYTRNLDLIRGLCHPGNRWYLYADRPGWDHPWRALVRADALTAPWQRAKTSSVQWRCPDGVWESVVEQTMTVYPDAGTGTGLTLPLQFAISFGAGTPASAGQVVVDGRMPVWPTLRIFGPCFGCQVTNQTSGATLSLPTLALSASQYVAIDMRNGTIYADSDPTISRLGYVDWTVSDFWQLQPGINLITYSPIQTSPPSQVEITWRDTML